MSNLDSKLDQILVNLIHGSKRKSGLGGRSYSDYKEQVKQAFVDEGWVSPEQKLQVMENVDKIVELANDNYERSQLLKPTPFIGKH